MESEIDEEDPWVKAADDFMARALVELDEKIEETSATPNLAPRPIEASLASARGLTNNHK